MHIILWKNKTCLDLKTQFKWHIYSLPANSWKSHCKCDDIISSTFYCNLTHWETRVFIIHYSNRDIVYRFDCITLSIHCFSFICYFLTNILIKDMSFESLKIDLILTDKTVGMDESSRLAVLYSWFFHVTLWSWQKYKEDDHASQYYEGRCSYPWQGYLWWS